MSLSIKRTIDLVKALREKNGLTQKDFGEKAGVSQGMVMYWESGKKPLSDKAIDHLCKSLNVDPSYFYTSPRFDDNQERTFLQNFRALTRADQELLDAMLKKMVLLQRLSDKSAGKKSE